MKSKTALIEEKNSSFLLLLSVAAFIVVASFSVFLKDSYLFQNTFNNSSVDEVSAYYYGKPQIYISGGNYKYSSGGVIPIASTDDPVVEIGGYQVSGKFIIDVYEADLEALQNYLVYKDNNEQVEKNINTDGFDFVTTVEHDADLNEYGSETKISLPLADRGIYYLRVKVGETLTNAFVIRSNIGAVVKEGDGQYLFWAQDFRSKRSLTSGNIKIYNFKNSVKELANVPINEQGIASSYLTAGADVAFVIQDKEVAVVPINLLYLNTGWNWQRFKEKDVSKRYFTFTDRPIYRPGDTIYFKSIIRDEDDVRYSIPQGSVEVNIRRGWNDENNVFERSYVINGDGTIDGEYTLADNAKTGDYSISVGENSVGFEVQEFRKPEYFLDVESSKREFVSGDKAEVVIRGEYFSGQPLAGRKVEYEVTSADFYEYTYLNSYTNYISDDYRYGWWYSGRKVKTGEVELNSQGQAVLELDTKLQDNSGRNQVVAIEVNYNDPGGEPVFDRKNILVYSGEYGIYRKDYSYGTKVGDTLSMPLKLVARREGLEVANKELSVEVKQEGYEKTEQNGKTYWKHYSDDAGSFTLKTDLNGEAEIRLAPQKQGSYNFTVKGSDSRGNEIQKTFYSYVRDRDYSYYWSSGESGIVITPDKQEYRPGDTAELTFYSDVPDRDVFLTFERARVNRYQVFHIDGKNKKLTLPIVQTDMPNIFVEATSFSNSDIDSGQEKLLVSAEQMRMQVDIKPDSTKYGPGDTAVIEVETRNESGAPVTADVTLWAVDKAIYELTNNKLADIFNTFWFERRNDTVSGHSLEGIRVNTAEMGGCFAEGTKVTMADGGSKNIEDVKAGDMVETRESTISPKLVSAKVSDVYETQVPGYLLINAKLRVTDNHKLLINGLWKEAASIRVGDVLVNEHGSEYVDSIEWVRGKFRVHNLHVEKYQTFFADGVYVHNQKGGPAREVLKDTAYWNPSIRTGADGKAVVNVKLPDNLTTWAFSAVAATNETMVGQAKTDVKVTKDIIVRPIIPNILREGDTIVLSALVQNFTDKDRTFNAELEFENGEVFEPEKNDIKIVTGGTEQLFWTVKPQVIGEAQLTYRVYDTGETSLGDVIVREIPVELLGFNEVRGYAGQGDKEYKITLSADAVNENSSVLVKISPTILGSLPQAVNYLVNYPYGCIEQTTSRLVPSIIVKRNASLFREILDKRDIDGIINKGLARLVSLQNNDGGWGWWLGESDPFISSYVVEYVLEAKADGYSVDEEMLSKVKGYFENISTTDENIKVSRYYALTLLNSDRRVNKMESSESMSTVMLSMLIMANTKNGIYGKDESGLNRLIDRAQRKGDTVYWPAGEAPRFGSVSASTAMAIRALVATGQEREMAVRAVRYLSQSRRRHYWENSFATAQTIRAIVDLSKTEDELNPSYTYKVSVDGNTYKSGYVGSVDTVVDEINIPSNMIDKETNIKVEKEGDGQLYSTLVVNEFRTDKSYEGGGSLKIKRKIVNEKGPNYTLGIGEVANVTLTVEGWPAGSVYAVVEDHLPSGMVPVIETLKNEQGGQQSNYWRYGQSREYTKDGVIFASSYNPSYTYTYRARVVNSGEFYIPPVSASLMYLPDISGTSGVEKFTIDKDSIKTYETLEEKLGSPEFRQQYKDFLRKENLIKAVSVLLAVVVAMFIVYKKEKDEIKLLFAVLKDWWRNKKTKGKEVADKSVNDGERTGNMSDGENGSQDTSDKS